MKQLIDDLIAFRDVRDWEKFHTPENLSRSIMIEAAELNRNYQWGDNWEDPDIENVKDELADVMIYCLTMCHELGVDHETIIREKMAKNEIKYPAWPYHVGIDAVLQNPPFSGWAATAYKIDARCFFI